MTHASNFLTKAAHSDAARTGGHAARTDRISRLVVILAHQHEANSPAFGAARRGRDTVLVEGDIDQTFAAALRSSGCRLADEATVIAPLETRIARALRYHAARRIAVTNPGDQALYERIVEWAQLFGVSVDIYRAGPLAHDLRTAA